MRFAGTRDYSPVWFRLVRLKNVLMAGAASPRLGVLIQSHFLSGLPDVRMNAACRVEASGQPMQRVVGAEVTKKAQAWRQRRSENAQPYDAQDL